MTPALLAHSLAHSLAHPLAHPLAHSLARWLGRNQDQSHAESASHASLVLGRPVLSEFAEFDLESAGMYRSEVADIVSRHLFCLSVFCLPVL